VQECRLNEHETTQQGRVEVTGLSSDISMSLLRGQSTGYVVCNDHGMTNTRHGDRIARTHMCTV
jgi:hypothetical protein